MGEKIKILCYGDSNTWGYIPGTDHQRFSKDERWPGALQRMLGDKYEIIEEGLNSRIVATTKKFVIMPMVGPLVPGYLLIVPKDHYLSIERLPKEQAAKTHHKMHQVLIAKLTVYREFP